MTWDANIEKVNNGYVLKLDSGNTDEENRELVYQINSDIEETKAEQLCIRELFHDLMEFFAVHNDKHKNQYLTIEVTEGKEYKGEEDEENK